MVSSQGNDQFLRGQTVTAGEKEVIKTSLRGDSFATTRGKNRKKLPLRRTSHCELTEKMINSMQVGSRGERKVVKLPLKRLEQMSQARRTGN